MPVVGIKELRAHIPPKTRLLGIDHSAQALGLALSDEGLSYATPFKTLRGKNFTENLKALATLCAEYHLRAFVIGLPLNMDDSEGPRAQSVRHFGLNLTKSAAVLGFEPVIAYQDERLSTHAVEQMLIEERGMKRDRIREVVDAHAAAYILQDALNAIRPSA